MHNQQPTAVKAGERRRLREQPLNRGDNLFAFRVRVDLLERCRQATGALARLDAQDQLLVQADVVVADRSDQRAAVLHHLIDQQQRLNVPWSTVDQVAEEDSDTATRMRPVAGVFAVAEIVEQQPQLAGAAVHVADHIDVAALEQRF